MSNLTAMNLADSAEFLMDDATAYANHQIDEHRSAMLVSMRDLHRLLMKAFTEMNESVDG